MTKSIKRRATTMLFLASIIWGLAFVAQRAAMDYMGPFLFNGARFSMGALALLPVALYLEKPGRNPRSARTLKTALIGGAVLFIAASLQQIGVDLTGSASKSGFITGLYIVLTPILAMALGKKTKLPTWFGAGLAVIGLYLLSVPSGFSSVEPGDLFLLGCAFFWAVHILVIDRYAGDIHPLCFAVIQFFVCGLLSLITAAGVENVSFAILISGRVPVLFSAVFSVAFAYTLQVIGQRNVEPSDAALIYSMESLFAVIGALILLGEVMDIRAYLGCALLFAGIIVSQARLPVKRGVDKHKQNHGEYQ